MEFIVQNAIKQSETTQNSDYTIGQANIKVIGVGGGGGPRHDGEGAGHCCTRGRR